MPFKFKAVLLPIGGVAAIILLVKLAIRNQHSKCSTNGDLESSKTHGSIDAAAQQRVEVMSLRHVSHPGVANPVIMKLSEINQPTKSTGLFGVIHPVLCDGVHCNKRFMILRFIRGIRFSCTTCDDIDFCEQCASSSTNSHDKSHILLKMMSPGIGQMVHPPGSLDGRLGELTDLIKICNGSSFLEFMQYYQHAGGVEQNTLLDAFHGLAKTDQIHFVRYFISLERSQRSLFLEQFRILPDNERQGYLRIHIGVERVIRSEHPLFNKLIRDDDPEIPDGYILMGNIRTICQKHVTTVELVRKDLSKRPVREKKFVFDRTPGANNDHFFGIMKPYQYRQDDGLHELWLAGKLGTRVLHLHPGKGNDQLECSIRAVVDWTSQNLADYEALSYTWKETSHDRQLLPVIDAEDNNTLNNMYEIVHPVFCDGGYFAIGTGLRNALLRVRDPVKTRALWVDQICINQNSSAERSYQVRWMGYIYRLAKRVIVWCGDEDEYTEAAFALMEALSQRSKFLPTPAELAESLSTVPPLGSSDWLSLHKFLRRPVFTRGWVIQEIVLGRKVVVKCGRHEIDFQKVSGAAAMINEPSWVLAPWRRELAGECTCNALERSHAKSRPTISFRTSYILCQHYWVYSRPIELPRRAFSTPTPFRNLAI